MRPQKPQKPEGIETPGLVWRPRAKHWSGYWIPRQDIAAQGYPIKSRLLWPPSTNLTATPEDKDWTDIGKACSLLQDEMLTWRSGGVGYEPRAIFDDTLASVVTIFLTDPDSPFKSLRHGTAITYERMLGYISKDVGHEKISALTFRDFKRWYSRWLESGDDGADRVSYAYERIKFLRIALSFGTLLKLRGCADAKAVLDEMEFKNPKSRVEFVTNEQSAAVCDVARDKGFLSIALAQTMQTDLMVRQKDVIGEWIPLSEPGVSSVIRGKEKWVVGFRWEEIDQSLQLSHRLSKSLRGKRSLGNADEGKLKSWRLPLYPKVMAALCTIAGVDHPSKLTREMLPASGPLIICEHSGRPWLQKVFAARWRKLARLAGIPDDVQNRDSRAGAATEAERRGADLETIRKGMGHSKQETTRIYTRDEEEAENRLVAFRFNKDKS